MWEGESGTTRGEGVHGHLPWLLWLFLIQYVVGWLSSADRRWDRKRRSRASGRSACFRVVGGDGDRLTPRGHTSSQSHGRPGTRDPQWLERVCREAHCWLARVPTAGDPVQWRVSLQARGPGRVGALLCAHSRTNQDRRPTRRTRRASCCWALAAGWRRQGGPAWALRRGRGCRLPVWAGHEERGGEGSVFSQPLALRVGLSVGLALPVSECLWPWTRGGVSVGCPPDLWPCLPLVPSTPWG